VAKRSPKATREPADVPSGTASADGGSVGLGLIRAWFAGLGWTPWEFQTRTWEAFGAGRSGLLQVPTGAGKTYAAVLGPLAGLINEASRDGKIRRVEGLRLLYITPLRAVARDIELALKRPVEELGLPFTVQSRTGDTTQSVRRKQNERLPNVLITTPESLTLLLTRENAAESLGGCRAVIVDEWHELLSSKRGTQTELALARLRGLASGVRTWALSATLENLEEAARAAAGVGVEPEIIRGSVERPVVIETLLPGSGRLPWAGHMGLSMLPEVLAWLDPDVSTLVFLNTRAQAELWHQAIRVSRPEWEPILGLHHGSIDRKRREAIEAGLKSGQIRIVVATSSLDLGVDFAPVERVMQIGSPKGLARLLQRAGRASHRPGAPCRIVCVPTHGLELVEVAAARTAIQRGRIEPRVPLAKPLDVLVQHLVSCSLGAGFRPDALFEEVRGAYSYRDLTRQEFDWCMELVRDGGKTLGAYPEHHRIMPAEPGPDPLHRIASPRLGALHRLNIGTITGEMTLDIRYASGKRLGSIEEYFISQMSPESVSCSRDGRWSTSEFGDWRRS
jgi:ATP-dependent Lhr-like helicase